MSESVLICCPSCLRTNRVPQDRLGQQPSCGQCGRELFQGRPHEVVADQFERLTSRTELPVLVDCWAPWCGPCLQFAPVFSAAATKLEPHWRLLKLDTEQHPQLAARLQIRSIPTLLVLRQGVELARTSGAMPLPALLNWLRPWSAGAL